MIKNCLEVIIIQKFIDKNKKYINLKFLQNIYKSKNVKHLFSGCKQLKKIFNLNLINIESVKNMKKLFNACGKLEEIDGLNKMRKDNAEILDCIFNGC